MWCRRACQSSCNTYNNNLKVKRKNIEYNNMLPKFKLPGVQWCEVLLEASGLKLKVPHNPEEKRVRLLLPSYSLTWSLKGKTPYSMQKPWCPNGIIIITKLRKFGWWENKTQQIKKKKKRDREKSTKAKSDSQHQQQQKYDVMPKKIKGEEGKKGENVWCSHDVVIWSSSCFAEACMTLLWLGRRSRGKEGRRRTTRTSYK